MADLKIDINDFPSLPSVDDASKVLLAQASGAAGKVTVSLLKQAISSGIIANVTPKIEDGVWWIGSVNTGIQAEGLTPEFRAGEEGIEWKYTTEAVESWRLLVLYSAIGVDFDSLTPEQQASLKLKYSDLTPEDIADLQRPANDMIAVLSATNTSVTNAEALRVIAEGGRVNAETARVQAESGRQVDETARIDAENNRALAEQERVQEFAALKLESETQSAYAKEQGDYAAEKIPEFDERLSDTEENIANILATNPLQTYAYGVDIDYTVADYARTRIGNLSLHAQLPVQIQMSRCLLLDNGKVNYYLDENNSDLKEDGTPSNLTGADGMYQVELPKHYRRFIESGTKMQAYISDLPLPGFHLVPKMYISAVEASIDRTNPSQPKLASVVNSSAAFRGGNNTAAWDGTYRTLLGRPGTNTSLTNFRAYARRRGSAGMNGAGWNAYLYEAHLALYWLYTIEYANTNCQLPFNATPTANGYKQGGLGDGVTNMSDWGGFNGSNPFIPCGLTNSLGNKTGVVSYTTKNEDGTARDTLSVPTYRGIENPFGHLWKWTDGVKCRIQSNEAGGLSEVYTCNNPANFQDVNYDNYVNMGDMPRTDGYIKKIIGGEHGIIMPAEVGGSSNTYFCDYFYTNIPATSEAQRGVLLGGRAYNGAAAGLSCASANDAASIAGAGIGSRLCFLPA